MKYLLVVMSLGLAACGAKSGGNGGVNTVYPTPNTVQHTLTASNSVPASYILTQGENVQVPAQLAILANLTEYGRAELVLGAYNVTYERSGGVYVFKDCTGGCVVGSAIALGSGSVISLSVTPGYVTQATTLQAVVNGSL